MLILNVYTILILPMSPLKNKIKELVTRIHASLTWAILINLIFLFSLRWINDIKLENDFCTTYLHNLRRIDGIHTW
jgi:hypothetical protein